MQPLSALLKQKRKALGEMQGEFAKRIYPDLKSHVSSYSQIEHGKRALTEKRFPTVAKVLGISVEEVTRAVEADRIQNGCGQLATCMLNADQLRYMANIAEAVGYPMSVKELLSMLHQRPPE